MLNLTPQHIIKYLSVALIVAVILYIIPGEKLENLAVERFPAIIVGIKNFLKKEEEKNDAN